MGQKIHLVRIAGECPRCHKTVDGYGYSPSDATIIPCPRCRRAIQLHAGHRVLAWEVSDGNCYLIESEVLQPPDTEPNRLREVAILKLGLGLASACKIRSSGLPDGLATVHTAVSNCISCNRHDRIVYLTEWQKKRTVCRLCGGKLYFHSERSVIAATDGRDYWPLTEEAPTLIHPFHRDLEALSLTAATVLTDFELELLGLK